jgi:hypothetical protein
MRSAYALASRSAWRRSGLGTRLRLRSALGIGADASSEFFGRYVGGGKRNHFKVPGTAIQSVAEALAVVDETVMARTSRGGPCF